MDRNEKHRLHAVKKRIFDLFTGIHYEAADNGESEILTAMNKELETVNTFKDLRLFVIKYKIKKLFRFFNEGAFIWLKNN
jgi:predicted RNA binding protein with dsRBD fold (UPF0201 family)